MLRGHEIHGESFLMDASAHSKGPGRVDGWKLWKYCVPLKSGWWFGTWILWLSIIWDNNPNWRTHIFQRCRAQPPSRNSFQMYVHLAIADISYDPSPYHCLGFTKEFANSSATLGVLLPPGNGWQRWDSRLILPPISGVRCVSNVGNPIP